MARTIWKYELSHIQRQRLSVPCDFRVLGVIAEHDKALLYILVDPNVAPQDFVVFCEFTGQPFSADHACGYPQYIGTVRLEFDYLDGEPGTTRQNRPHGTYHYFTYHLSSADRRQQVSSVRT